MGWLERWPHKNRQEPLTRGDGRCVLGWSLSAMRSRFASPRDQTKLHQPRTSTVYSVHLGGHYCDVSAAGVRPADDRPLKHPTAGPMGVELGQRTNLVCPSSTAAPRLSSLALQPRHDTCALFTRSGGPHPGMDHEAWRLWGQTEGASQWGSAALCDRDQRGPPTASQASQGSQTQTPSTAK